jgi:hypothetical protein
VYRDATIALDEHDRAVGAILIAEALCDLCDRDWRSLQDHGAKPRRHWLAFAELHVTIPDVWHHLDRARRVLAQRGANTAGYDERRPNTKRGVDSAALDGVRRGIEELKLAVPGADWKAIETRTRGLVRLPLARRRQRLAIGWGSLALAGTMASWIFAVMPDHKPRTAQMATQLHLVTEQRRLNIDILQARIGDRCTPSDAHELMRLLVLDGRRDDARAFGGDYIARCGDDLVVENWARAPKPKQP